MVVLCVCVWLTFVCCERPVRLIVHSLGEFHTVRGEGRGEGWREKDRARHGEWAKESVLERK